MKSGENDRKKGGHVGSIILHTVTGYGFLSAGMLIAVVGAVVLALIPPLVLGDIVDTLTTGSTLPLRMVVFYFIMLAMTGIMESAREGLLTVFGQKITHAVAGNLSPRRVWNWLFATGYEPAFSVDAADCRSSMSRVHGIRTRRSMARSSSLPARTVRGVV